MSATGEPHDACAGRDAGATLLEMLVVVAILGLTAGLGAASFRPVLQHAALAAARGQLVLALAQTRAEAMHAGAQRRLEATADGGGYVAAGRQVTLPAGVRLRLEPTEVSFDADGLSSGARLQLSAGGRRLDLAAPSEAAAGPN